MCPGQWTKESGTQPWREGHRESWVGWGHTLLPGKNLSTSSQTLSLCLSRDDHLQSFAILALACLSCYNEISPTGWVINNRNLLLTVVEGGSPNQGTSIVPFWREFPSWFMACTFSLCLYMMERAMELSEDSFIRALIQFIRSPPSWPNHLPKVHILIPSSLGGLHINILIWGERNIQTIPWPKVHSTVLQNIKCSVELPQTALF